MATEVFKVFVVPKTPSRNLIGNPAALKIVVKTLIHANVISMCAFSIRLQIPSISQNR